MAIFSFYPASTLQAQITIGLDEEPLSGSLLQLKDSPNVAEGSANATKGLMLPRVNLTNLFPPTPAELSASIGGSDNWNIDTHIGLMVYNVREDQCAATPILAGTYVWSGEEWQPLFNPNLQDKGVEIFTDTRDGNNEQYQTGDFGTAGRWFLENLRYLPTDGSITLSTSSDTYTKMSYFYPNGTSSNIYGTPPSTWDPRQGLLYNWIAATYGQNPSTANQGQVSGTVPGSNEVESAFEPPETPGQKNGKIQGLCPAGWHVPSDREWNDLEREVYTNPQKYSKYADNSLFPNSGVWNSAWETSVSYRPVANNTADAQGKAMKSPCPISLSYPTYGISNRLVQNGFSVLLAGYAIKGGPILFGQGAYFQSSSSNTAAFMWSRMMNDANSSVYRIGTYYRNYLLSVRCKKD